MHILGPTGPCLLWHAASHIKIGLVRGEGDSTAQIVRASLHSSELIACESIPLYREFHLLYAGSISIVQYSTYINWVSGMQEVCRAVAFLECFSTSITIHCSLKQRFQSLPPADLA